LLGWIVCLLILEGMRGPLYTLLFAPPRHNLHPRLFSAPNRNHLINGVWLIFGSYATRLTALYTGGCACIQFFMFYIRSPSEIRSPSCGARDRKSMRRRSSATSVRGIGPLISPRVPQNRSRGCALTHHVPFYKPINEVKDLNIEGIFKV
jgi:hypothetical protein